MLQITISGDDFYNEATEEFITVKTQKLTLEHSLLSISKWESKWKRSFLSNGPNGYDELIDYIRCMTITPNVNPLLYKCITPQDLENIRAYMTDTMTATTIQDLRPKTGSPKRHIVTSEQIYSWMISLEIPFSCEKWHINRLLMLIRVCSIERNKGMKGSKMKPRDVRSQYAAINAARRSKYHTSG